MTGEETGDKDSDEFGIRVSVMPNSPAAKAGLPDSMIVTAWQNEKLKSVAELKRHLSLLTLDADVTFRYRTTGENPTETEAAFKAGARSDRLVSASDAVMTAVTGSASEKEWKRQEEAIGEEGSKVWFFAPTEKSDSRPGLVVLLSESTTPAEAVLRRWKDVCRQYNLIPVIPVNAENTDLTTEDAALVTGAVGAVTIRFSPDPDRIVLVTSESQADLCGRLLFNPRLAQLRSAVFQECRPRISGLPAQMLAAKSPSVLLLNGVAVSRQDQALQQQSVRQLSDAGAWVLTAAASDTGSELPEGKIALWTVNLKAR